jgi:LuxR family transcriptional regulator/LuxR family quorum-sensing system transcriptional regulator CciR
MAKRQSLAEFMFKCNSMDQVHDLWGHSLGFLLGRGVRMVTWHSDEAQMPWTQDMGVITDGAPAEWVRRYTEDKLYETDPMPGVAKRHYTPFWWSEAADLTTFSDSEALYMENLSSSGLSDGLGFQVYGPNLRNAYVGLGYIKPVPPLTERDIFELKCAAQTAHIRYCELTEDQNGLAFHLSPREHEVLGWIARGKSNSVIGEIMGISRHTVDTMTRRMFDKMNVRDRTTAVMRGVGSGLLNPYRDG